MASVSWMYTAATATARRLWSSSSVTSAFSSQSSSFLTTSAVGISSCLLLLPIAPFNSTTATTVKTTKCEEVLSTTTVQQRKKTLVNLQPRMTSMGRFAWLSETADNPSVPTIVVALVGAPFTARDFEHAWQRRHMSERHVRFQQRIAPLFTNEKSAAAGNGSGSGGLTYFNFTPTYQPLSHNVSETSFPNVYRSDVKDRLLLLLTQPFPVHDILWKVQISSGGRVGQSGVIPKVVAQSIVAAENDVHTPVVAGVPQQRQQQESSSSPSTESLIVFSAHHALGDGVSLSAAFTELCDEGPAIQEMIEQEWNKRRQIKRLCRGQKSFWQRLQNRLASLFRLMWGIIRSLLYQLELWIKSPSQNPLEELLLSRISTKKGRSTSRRLSANGRRTLSWCQVASVEEMKRVARSFGEKVTVNDLLVSCVSAAIAKLLQHHRQHLSILEETQNKELNDGTASAPHKHDKVRQGRVKSINVVIPVHLGGGVLLPGQSLGNRIGAMLARIPCELSNGTSGGRCSNKAHYGNGVSEDELEVDQKQSVYRLEQIHTILGRVKQSPAAIISHVTARALASLPCSSSSSSSWISRIFTKSHLGATCVITNVRGPAQEMHLEGRRVVAAQAFLPLPPGIPIGVALFSYAGAMNVSINAQAWAVPNSDQFLLWVVEEYERLADISLQQV